VKRLFFMQEALKWLSRPFLARSLHSTIVGCLEDYDDDDDDDEFPQPLRYTGKDLSATTFDESPAEQHHRRHHHAAVDYIIGIVNIDLE
jgi:hypothetical protein